MSNEILLEFDKSEEEWKEKCSRPGEGDLSIMKFRYENVPTVVVPPLVQRAA